MEKCAHCHKAGNDKKPGKALLPDIMKLRFVILSVRNVMHYHFPNSTGFMRIHLNHAYLLNQDI